VLLKKKAIYINKTTIMLKNIFLCIKERLIANIPELKGVSIYNSQNFFPEDFVMMSPSVYIDFGFIEYETTGYKRQQGTVELTVKLFHDSLEMDHLKVFELQRKVDLYLTNFGEWPGSSMNRISSQTDDQFDQLYVYDTIYETMFIEDLELPDSCVTLTGVTFDTTVFLLDNNEKESAMLLTQEAGHTDLTISFNSTNPYTIDWGDGVVEDKLNSSGNFTHTWETEGEHNVRFYNSDYTGVTHTTSRTQGITKAVFAPQMINVKNVFFDNNELTEIAINQQWDKTEQIELTNNKLTEFETGDWPVVFNIELDGNELTTFDGKASWVNLGEIRLNNNNLVTANAHREWAGTSFLGGFWYDAGNNNLDAASINEILNEIDLMGNSGDFVLLNGGTNASPDATSGGVDGITAYMNIASRGGIVNTN
jgi:hypothetical protein